MKKLLSLSSIVVFLAACTAPVVPNDDQEAGTSPIVVAASFYPLAFFAEQIGGSAASVLQVTPGGMEPHEYVPSPQQLVAIHSADVFLMNGAGVDSWGDSILEELGQNGSITLRMTDEIAAMQGEVHEEEEDEHEEDAHGHDHEQGEYDPHIWLSPMLAAQQVALIRDALIKADPAHADLFRANADALTQQLSSLDADFRTGLSNCALQFIVTSHNAFRYLAKEYDFETLAIAGLNPAQEPSPKRIAELADLAREKNIQFIFFERLVSPKLAETLANEIGAESLVLHPLEGLTAEEEAQGEDYISMMRNNLNNLRTAMQCQ